jgi:hypothetical protein
VFPEELDADLQQVDLKRIVGVCDWELKRND